MIASERRVRIRARNHPLALLRNVLFWLAATAAVYVLMVLAVHA